ncbi:MAG: hypothetical protein HZA54_20985 [Planctomycetes bacterium]|nr:hypothetical protein [Planctomycetota bacterium]
MRSRPLPLVLSLACGLFVAAAALRPLAAEEACPVEVPAVAIARAKVGNRVTVEATLKNVGGADLGKLSALFVALDGEGKPIREAAAEKDLLPAGRSCVLAFALSECPEFGAYRLSLRFVRGSGDESWSFRGADLAAPPVLERPEAAEQPAEAAGGESPGAGDPPPGPVGPAEATAPAPGKDPKAPAKSPPGRKSKADRIELAGVISLKGEFVGKRKELRYTGDLHFLKVRLLDAQGKPVRQAGKFEIIAFAEGRAVRNHVNQIGAATWGVDASKLQRGQGAERSTAFDAPRGETWVAFAVTQEEKVVDWKLDVRFTSAEGEVWLWKKVENPFAVAAQAPGK